MTEFDQQLRIKLASHKEKTGKSYYQIADDLGIHVQTIYDFRSGKRSLTSINIQKVIEYLGLTVELKSNEK